MRKLALLVVLAGLTSGNSQASGQCVNYDDYLHWISRTSVVTGRLAFSGERGYVTADSVGLQILDVSDPRRPYLLNIFDTPGACRDVRISGNYAFVADAAAGLQVIDVSNASNPSIVASLSPGSVGVLDIQGTLGVIVGGGVLRTIDVSNPLAPEVLGSVATPNAGFDVQISGGKAYVGGSDGFRIVDISAPSSPAVLGFLSDSGPHGYINAVDVVGTRAYIVDGASGDETGILRIIDISNAAAPVQIGLISLYNGGRDVFAEGDLVFCSSGAGVEVYDVSDPAYPVDVAALTGDAPGMIARNGNYLYATGYDGTAEILNVYDISTIAPPPMISNIPGSDAARDIQVRGQYAYTAGRGGNYGFFEVWNTLDPANPSLVSSLQFPYASRAGRLDVNGSFAYVLRESAGLQVIDVSNPAAPMVAGIADTPGEAMDVVVAGSYAYVADGASGLSVVQITNPSSPALLISIDTPGTANGVTLSGTCLYLADGDAGLQVFDLSAPGSPNLVATVDTPDMAEDVAIRGQHLYVTDGSSFLVFDISIPTSPGLLGSCDTRFAGHGIALAGDFVYLGGDAMSPTVLNIADPAAPFLVGSHLDVHGSWGMAVTGDYVYVASGEFCVLPKQCAGVSAVPEQPAGGVAFLSPPYPNPSRGTTAFSYRIPVAGQIEIFITDVVGRCVRSLSTGWHDAGEGAVYWDGRNSRDALVAPGLYFIRMDWNGSSAVQRVLRFK